MTNSLRWLLDQHELDLRLISGDPSVEVEWVHGVELEDPTPFLRGGEFVLTTGQRLPRSRANQRAYVARLVERRVAALGFGTGVRFPTVPEPLAAACADLGLPLVEVPLPTPFLAITRAFAERVAQQERAQLQSTADFQRRLTQVAVQEGERAAVAAAGAHLGRPIGVIDRTGTSTDRIPASFAEHLRRAAGHLPEAARVFANADVEIHPLAGQLGGTAWLATTSQPPLTQLQRLSLHHLILVVTLLREMPTGLQALRSSLARVTIGQLQRDAVEEDAIRDFGLLPDTVAAIVALPSSALARRARDSWAATASTGFARPGTMVGPMLDGVVLLLPSHQVDEARESAALSSAHLGVARPEVGDLKERIRAAGAAARSARRRGLRCLEFGTLDLATSLSAVVGEELGALVGPALRRVDDQADGKVLTASLVAFLRAHGRLELAAKELGVHRHTVSARISRVVEVTHLDLDDPDVRAALWLTLAQRRETP